MPIDYIDASSLAEVELDITSQDFRDDDEASAPPPVSVTLPAQVLALLAQPGDDPADPGTPTLTFIRSDRAATKSYRVEDGKPTKSAEPPLSSATAYRARLRGDAPLMALCDALESLPAEVVLACGAMVAVGDIIQMTTAAEQAATPGAITRTKGWAKYRAAMPGLGFLDHDAKDLPDELRARLKAAGGLEGVLASVCPEFGIAGLLVRPSVSTGIRCKSTGAVSVGGGMHLFFIAKDGSDIQAFARRLSERLILAGWGWVFITKTGQASVRSLIDTSASGDPERLVFEANAVLVGKDIEHVPGSRDGTVSRDGVIFETRALSELSEAEKRRFAEIEKQLLDAQASEIAAKRAEAVKDRAAKLVARGIPAGEAEARAAKTLTSYRLDPADVIVLDDGRNPTVAEIRRDPWAYDGATGADPLEPDYGGGRNKALICITSQSMTIRSQAHGGQIFDIAPGVEDVIAAWDTRPDQNEIKDMLPYLKTDEAGRAALAAAGVPSRGELTFGRDLDAVALTAIAAAPAPVSAPAWTKQIALDRGGTPKPTLTNARLGLGVGCGLDEHLWLDLATGTLVLRGVLQGSAVWAALGLDCARPLYADPLTGVAVFEWTDAMLTNARGFLDAWDMRVSKEMGRDVVAAIAARNTFSSVGAYLRGLDWDGIPRLDGWLVRNAGAEATRFNELAFSKWAIAAVARALFPEERGAAAKVDTILTLIGGQDLGKSAFFRLLCAVPLWHTESALGDLNSKDAVLRIISTWIVDMSEGSSVKANEVETFKQFVTVLADNVRLPYASTTTRHPRRCIFGMNVNPDGTGFAKDPTGNRRIWAVEVGDIDMALLVLERDQLWAEAVHRFDAGQKWWFDKHDVADAAAIAEAAAAVEEHRSRTPIEEALRRYVCEEPTIGMGGRIAWKPRVQPLSVIGVLSATLADLGFQLTTPNTRDAERGLTAMGWRKTKVQLKGAAVAKDAHVWVGPEGVKALKRDKPSRGRAGVFRRWLDEEHAEGRIHASAAPGSAAEPASDFADVSK